MTMNTNINALIVDDEQDGREVLQQLLALHAPQIKIIGQASSAAEACSCIDQLRPDLVFLDIQMSGQNGFDVLQHYPEVNFEVIFVTSYDQYALTAIKFNALDYLLKPLAVDELKAATAKAIHRIHTKQDQEDRIKSLLESLDQHKGAKKIAVHVRDSVHLLDISDIMYVLAEGNYSRVVTQQGGSYMMSRMLKELECYIGNDLLFMRINKSTMANPAFIVKYSKGEPCIITMKDGQTYEVSRRKKQEILDVLQAKATK